ncbi:MAG: endonuclease MutS2 [Clostridiaceae bacterium]|nr:endonuclease MutS2 [Clostridiaceae bacterium]
MTSYKSLEFDQILSLLSRKAASKSGAAACLQLFPETDIERIRSLLNETEAALSLLFKGDITGMPNFPEVAESADYAAAGLCLSCAQLLQVNRFLSAVSQVYRYLPPPEVRSEETVREPIYKIIATLSPLPELERIISRSVENDERLSDAASSELAAIRRRISRTESKVRDFMTDLVRRRPTALQESIVTQRGGRFVVPVRREAQQDIPGIIHDTSGSGQTLFIEPMGVVDMNNEIRRLRGEEEAETERILRDLSSRVAAGSDRIISDQKTMSVLDLIFARARLAMEQNGQRPRLNTAGKIRLVAARHPLLDPATVVPITLELGYENRALLITGPNTGGKTVALKTCGLLTLMAQSGLFIPAAEHSEIAVFEKILVAIGDGQSIAESLSTFSAHIKQLENMCREADQFTLILADELGSGTDPREGAALARAVLEYWYAAGATIIATTHYSELKYFVMNTPGYANASCEFDGETLKPTYKLLMGIPGTSHAIEISRRLGLPESVLSRATTLLDTTELETERVLQEAIRLRYASENALERAREAEETARRAQAKAEAQLEQLRENRREILNQEREKIRSDYLRGLSELDEHLKFLRNDEHRSREGTLRLTEQVRRSAGQELNALEGEIGRATLQRDISGAKPSELIVGETYYAPGIGFTGVLTSEPDNKGNCTLSRGGLRITVPAEDLRLPDPDQTTRQTAPDVAALSDYYRHKAVLRDSAASAVESASASRSRQRQSRSRARGAAERGLPGELMLIGKTVEEALIELDRYMDRAALSGLTVLRIVHGKGSGILRNAVQEALQKDPRVNNVRLAPYGEGDSGVTLADFT